MGPAVFRFGAPATAEAAKITERGDHAAGGVTRAGVQEVCKEEMKETVDGLNCDYIRRSLRSDGPVPNIHPSGYKAQRLPLPNP